MITFLGGFGKLVMERLRLGSAQRRLLPKVPAVVSCPASCSLWQLRRCSGWLQREPGPGRLGREHTALLSPGRPGPAAWLLSPASRAAAACALRWRLIGWVVWLGRQQSGDDGGEWLCAEAAGVPAPFLTHTGVCWKRYRERFQSQHKHQSGDLLLVMGTRTIETFSLKNRLVSCGLLLWKRSTLLS